MSIATRLLLTFGSALAIMAFIGCLFWAVAAETYRSQHCIYVLGHWLSVERTTNPWFCQ